MFLYLSLTFSPSFAVIGCRPRGFVFVLDDVEFRLNFVGSSRDRLMLIQDCNFPKTEQIKNVKSQYIIRILSQKKWNTNTYFSQNIYFWILNTGIPYFEFQMHKNDVKHSVKGKK